MKREALNLDEEGQVYYQFSVLLVDDDGDFKLIYSYWENGEIKVRKEFEDISKYIVRK